MLHYTILLAFTVSAAACSWTWGLLALRMGRAWSRLRSLDTVSLTGSADKSMLITSPWRSGTLPVHREGPMDRPSIAKRIERLERLRAAETELVKRERIIMLIVQEETKLRAMEVRESKKA